ncbi:hypothetical protein BDW71DRAFT_185879 [Aspergillus fruticulosus]
MATRGTVREHDPDNVKEFYEMVCFTRYLSPVRGNRIKLVSSAESDGFSVAKCRRDFADAIAYFCAYNGDPDSVTAVALGKMNTKVILWVASNANVPRKVIDFLENDVLNIVQGLAHSNTKQGQLPSGEPEIVASLLQKILQFTRKRIFKYYKAAIVTWKDIREFSNPEGLGKMNTDISMFCEWFKSGFYKSGIMLEECDMPDLAIRCYIARINKIFGVLRHGSCQGNEQRLDYERLYKLLGKLGKHIGLFERMMHATDTLRRDFREGFIVKSIPASTPKRIPLPELNEQAMEKIVARVFRTEDERDHFYHHLNRFYNKEEIFQFLQSCKEKSRVRVHAEILLIDYFDKFGGDFFDNEDKYIGCSKPACYLCYQYIREHPANYTLPPTHQKLYHSWSLPIVRANDHNYAERLGRHKRFLHKVTDTLRSDLRNEVQRQVAPRKHHADSTAGTSSIADTGTARPTRKASNHAICALVQLIG